MRRLTFFLLAALPLGGCTSAGPTCGDMSFPAPPSDAGEPLFVAAACPAEGADGSRDHPFSRIADALSSAASGQTILVAEGTSYEEELVIDRPVRLLGSPPKTAAEDATTTLRPAVGVGITVSPGVTGVVVRGLVIERAKGAGVWIAGGASAQLDGVRVHEVELDGDGNYGYGVLVSDGGSADLVRTAVDGAPSIGIYVKAATATMEQVDIHAVSDHGAIRLEDTSAPVTIKDATVTACGEVGVLVASSTAKIDGGMIAGILLSKSGVGDGIVVMRRKGADGAYLADAHADIDGTTVTAAARVGVMFSDGATGSLQGSTVASCAPNVGFGAGVWLQSGAGGEDGVLVTKNTIHNNGFLGIGVTSLATAKITENLQIDSTFSGLVFVGDQYFDLGAGLGVFKGARATVESNEIHGNAGEGAIFDEAAAGTTFQSNDVVDNGGFGVLVQHPTYGIPPFANNHFENNSFGPSSVLAPQEQGHVVRTDDLQTP